LETRFFTPLPNILVDQAGIGDHNWTILNHLGKLNELLAAAAFVRALPFIDLEHVLRVVC